MRNTAPGALRSLLLLTPVSLVRFPERVKTVINVVKCHSCERIGLFYRQLMTVLAESNRKASRNIINSFEKRSRTAFPAP